MDNIYSNSLNKKVIKSILDIIILQLIKDKPTVGYKILIEIYSRFNIFLSHSEIYSALSHLKKQGLITYTSDKILTLTEKGETVRRQLIMDYLELQKEVGLSFK